MKYLFILCNCAQTTDRYTTLLYKVNRLINTPCTCGTAELSTNYYCRLCVLPDYTGCSAGKGITFGKATAKQKPGSNFVALPGFELAISYFVVLPFTTELSTQVC